MAHLPGRRTEHPLKHFALLLLVLLASASPAAGQRERPDGSGPRAGIEANLLLTQVASDVVWMAGGLALVQVASRLEVGGAARLMFAAIPLERPGTALDLELGYGGAVVSADFPLPGGSPGLTARALLGAGNADVRDRVTGAMVDSDNFGVIEPEVLFHISLTPRLSARVGASYRVVFGVEDLPGASGRQLSAGALVTGLRLGTR